MNAYDKKWSLNNESFQIRFTEICKEFEIKKPENVVFYSQQNEEKYVIQYLLNKKVTDGTFLEVGGCDGVLYNNTKTLEEHFGFKGILIEPQRNFYKKLKQNRSNCECYNCAVSDSDVPYIEFMGEDAEGGIVDTLNTNIAGRKSGFSIFHPSTWKLLFKDNKPYKVENRKMSDVLKKSKFDYIDFMFIDVEGGELGLLKSIDYSYPIFCIFIEAHSDQPEKNEVVRNYLISKGFTFRERQEGNEVWLNHNYFRKHLFNI